MLGYVLFGVFWILLAIIWWLPVPRVSQFPLQADHGDDTTPLQTDWGAYQRAGDRYSRTLLQLFVTMVLVGILAKHFFETDFESPVRSLPETGTVPSQP